MDQVTGSERKTFVNITTAGVQGFEKATDEMFRRMAEKTTVRQVANTAAKLKPLAEFLANNPAFHIEIGGLFTGG